MIRSRMPRLGLRLVAVVVAVLALVVAAVVFVDFDDVGNTPPAARRGDAKVTEADNGGEVTVKAGRPFAVQLKGSEDAPWGLPQATSEALALTSSSLDLDGSAGAMFVPQEVTPGVTITAERVPACQTATPPCDLPTERFEVTVKIEA